MRAKMFVFFAILKQKAPKTIKNLKENSTFWNRGINFGRNCFQNHGNPVRKH